MGKKIKKGSMRDYIVRQEKMYNKYITVRGSEMSREPKGSYLWSKLEE